MKVLNFNKDEYPFKELVEDLYDIKLNELDDNLEDAQYIKYYKVFDKQIKSRKL